MSKNKTGGPAFPIPIAGCSDGGVYNTMEQSAGEYGGMTLRDWFAGRASEADIEAHTFDVECVRTAGSRRFLGTRPCSREAAKYAYADAMLAEREQS